ncbi:hypothetical protein GCM10010331_74850 [Streptomyces xanthochromogenes]|uniref:hypothetical protein n=1 Tax=Streptomyces xanthochromogenes TaxID=67384 RepID=UPI0016742B58|nr:hypothetical protein [Streptomyces xanthochromogenes]GHB76001.1 hypothetical protein GCM10010331_74850 [Streptomyces xanthochromogenes]
MTITSQTPAACRVQLGKAPAEYLVIADDGPAADDVCAGRTPVRRVRYVERRAVDPVERRLQWDELEGDCLDAEGTVRLLAVAAVSHGHAAHVARREFAAFNAAVRMGDEIGRRLERAERGWLAIRIADGRSDGELYGDYEDAFAAQEHPGACTYFPISPLSPWTPRMCAEHLEFMTHLRHGCMVYGRPTCR